MAKSKRGKEKQKQKQKQNKTHPPANSEKNKYSDKRSLIPQTSFKALLTMLSDWHIGSGAGRFGDIDRLIQKDTDNLPYVPAKTLTGMWRDACELVALGLDEGDQRGVWMQWVDFLFGDMPALNQEAQTALLSPRSAALSIRSARLSLPLRQALNNHDSKSQKILKEALTFVKPGISIDPVTGCAKENFLRFEELVRGGTVLEADCELNLAELTEKQKLTAYSLLVAGTKLLERLGGKRRRGMGKCLFEIEQENKGNFQNWIEWIEQNLTPPLPPSPPEKDREDQRNREEKSSRGGDGWVKVSLEIVTKLPVIIRARTVGNVVETLDYIPGTYLLPIICKKLGSLGVNLATAIASKEIIVTNATIEVDRQPGRAVPLSLFYEKLGGGFEKGKGIYNLLKQKAPQNKQLKGYRQGYLGATSQSDSPSYAQVETIIQTHNTIEDRFQRPTIEVGGVYSYQAITSGTILQAELRLKKSLFDVLENKKQDWWHFLEGSERIGQSKKDDYGLVDFKVIGQPKEIKQRFEGNTSQLTVWLLSDVLLRNHRLYPTIELPDFIEALTTALNREQDDEQKVNLTEEKQILEETAENERQPLAFIRSRRTESWQMSWGLPRPSLVGLMAGSCMVIKVKGNLDPQRLAQLEIEGIGKRCVEGYGQICFNDPLLTSETIAQSKERSPQNQSSNNEPRSQTLNTLTIKKSQEIIYKYAQLLEKETWKEAIARSALALAATRKSRQEILGIKIEGKESYPSMSQLGALRSVISRLQEPQDSISLTSWIESIESVPNRLEKWQKTDDSLNKIRNLVTNLNLIWTTLNTKITIPLESLTLTEGAERSLTAEEWELVKQTYQEDWDRQRIPQVLQLRLWAEAIRTLVDACICAHKRDWENSELKD